MTSCIAASLVFLAASRAVPTWHDRHAIEPAGAAMKTVGPDPWLLSPVLQEPVAPEASCVIVEAKVSAPVRMQLYWMRGDEGPAEERSVRIYFSSPGEYATKAVDLAENGTFAGATRFRLDPADGAGVTFDIRRVAFVRPADVPPDLVPGLLQFHCHTAKLHYQPGERIDYRATLATRCYPDRASSKVLRAWIENNAGTRLAEATLQYGLRPNTTFKEVQGVIEPPAPLPPGGYVLRAESRDQRSGLLLTSEHRFGVSAPDDVPVYETPFKFVKDFSLVRGPDDRWHVFSITGDFFGTHGWSEDGQERTFSHASSADLRSWTIHPPVISISNATYPDGNGHYQDRNVWAPHVIRHQGKYWMFYTSVNLHVSQSISLATSEDLFAWTEYAKNPVFTLEGVEWAHWTRTGWADCRDPMVFADSDGTFYLYVTASARPPGESGAICVAESHDLLHWTKPRIAVRGPIVSESPQVWKSGERYYMTTSSHNHSTYVSRHPAEGWERLDFARPDIAAVEKHVTTSRSYAEEVVALPDGTHLMAALTFRYWGNSIYFFRLRHPEGMPAYDRP